MQLGAGGSDSAKDTRLCFFVFFRGDDMASKKCGRRVDVEVGRDPVHEIDL